ncbi:glutathione S-transferase [Actinobacillus equuli]|nr:glutathione S-transferase [Actinobacillus equuli]
MVSIFNSDVHKSFVPLFRLPSYAEGNEELTRIIRQQAAEQILNQLATANEHLESHISSVKIFRSQMCIFTSC